MPWHNVGLCVAYIDWRGRRDADGVLRVRLTVAALTTHLYVSCDELTLGRTQKDHAMNRATPARAKHTLIAAENLRCDVQAALAPVAK